MTDGSCDTPIGLEVFWIVIISLYVSPPLFLFWSLRKVKYASNMKRKNENIEHLLYYGNSLGMQRDKCQAFSGYKLLMQCHCIQKIPLTGSNCQCCSSGASRDVWEGGVGVNWQLGLSCRCHWDKIRGVWQGITPNTSSEITGTWHSASPNPFNHPHVEFLANGAVGRTIRTQGKGSCHGRFPAWALQACFMTLTISVGSVIRKSYSGWGQVN